MGENLSEFKVNPNHPVEMVSWDDCQEFISKLNTMQNQKFRLLTKAEWEYACRSGTTTRFYWGDDPDYEEIWDYAWFRANVGIQTHEVGKLKPNEWGLYDMCGNVLEWCEDKFGDYSKEEQIIPSYEYGASRVFRGGSWHAEARYCRSAFRDGSDAGLLDFHIGFRVALSRT